MASAPRPGWSRNVPREPPCARIELHTLSPDDYVSWHQWSEQMLRSHRALKCPACGRYAIWVPLGVVRKKRRGRLTRYALR